MATKPLCSIPNCGKPHYSLSYCRAHYRRVHLYGTPDAGRVSPGTALQWVAEHTAHQGNSCLPWPFCKSGDGYGRVYLPGHGYMTAPRYMCVCAHGSPPSRKHEAAHSCGKGHLGCVNPNHLRWALPWQNQADRILHGTVARGALNHTTKLSENQVREIRSLKGELSLRRIASRFDVSVGAVRGIHDGINWAWLE